MTLRFENLKCSTYLSPNDLFFNLFFGYCFAMKAVFFEAPGDAHVLKVGERPDPQPQGNQVVVDVQAAGVNHVDIWVRQGLPAYPVVTPHIPGADGAGVISAIGPESEGVSVGDRVVIAPGIFCGRCPYCLSGQDNQCDTFEILGAKRHGTYAEKVLVPDQNVVPLPDKFSYEEAAAFPLAYLTAWHMLTRAQLKRKETILIVGASSGVAMAAIQIAMLLGARVFAATTSPSKVPALIATNVDQVFLDDEKNDLVKLVHDHTKGRGVDVVLEHVGPATWKKSIQVVAKYGRIVTCGATTGPTVELELRRLFGRDVSIIGARMGTQREFQELCKAVFSGKLKPLIDKKFPLGEAAAAHQYMEEKKQVGKIILTV
jgi:NADPH:quinone reductase-like Zn-dependent oxidoreductase